MNKLHHALKQIPDWAFDQIDIVQELKCGPASDSWLLRYLDRQYVLRVDRPLAKTLPVKREQEVFIKEFAASHELTPATVYSDLSQGILLSHYAEGRTWSQTDLKNKSKLKRLAVVLRRLHSLRPNIESFDLSGAIAGYANTLQTPQSKLWADEAETLLQQVSLRPEVLCHNDLVVENIIDGKQLWLIDWEYAALGNPLFDLAIVVQHHQLEPALALAFLHDYFGVADEQTQFDFNCFCKIYDRVLALYSQVVRIAVGAASCRD